MTIAGIFLSFAGWALMFDNGVAGWFLGWGGVFLAFAGLSKG